MRAASDARDARKQIMHVLRAYKAELDLNNVQVTACKRHAGAARYADNRGLARKQDAYTGTGTSPSAIELHRELNVLKQTELPWMYDASTCAPQEGGCTERRLRSPHL
jgi:hypothetical protein